MELFSLIKDSQPPVPQNSAISGSSNNFPGAYGLHRGPFQSLSGFNDRISPYTSTPRVLDNTIDRPSGLMLGQNGNMYMDPLTRIPHQVGEIPDSPPFDETNILEPVITNGQTVRLEIQAKITNNKKFLHVDDKWTCYRRNYLSVTCSFTLHPWVSGPFYIKTRDQGTQQIRQFAVSISAIVNAQAHESRELVQHTPKRDKESERPPGRIVIQPQHSSSLGLGHGSAASGGGHHGFGLPSQSAGLLEYDTSYTNTSHSPQPPTSHSFERIQFQKATANNGKRRAAQQYYNLVVDLYAEVAGPSPGGTEWIKTAQRCSHPMVVRGRSPGHYKDGKESPLNTGHDGRSTGGSGDGCGTIMARSNMPLMPFSHSGGPYGRSDYHHQVKTEQSPLSDSPHISSSSSSTALDIGMLSDSMDPLDSMKATSSMGSYDGGFSMASPLDRKVGVGAGTGATGGAFRHPLSSFEYDTFSKDSEVSGSSFPDTVTSMASMIPNEQNDTSSSYLRNPPRLPSQPSSAGGYDPIYSDGSYGRYDAVQNSQGLCT